MNREQGRPREMAPQRVPRTRGAEVGPRKTPKKICRSHWVVVARLPILAARFTEPSERSRASESAEKVLARQPGFYTIPLDFAESKGIYTGAVMHVSLFSFGAHHGLCRQLCFTSCDP